MRFVTLLSVSLAFATACKKDSGAADAIGKMSQLKDKMCACTDQACIDQVSAEMKAAPGQKPGTADKMSADDQKKLMALSEEMGRCMTRVASEAAAARAGSAAEAAGAPATGAGAGTGAEGAAMGAGAAAGSSAAGGSIMAHQAGMCPSTVLGATTSAAVKGKTVVLAIEATDRDAIAAIQKRAERVVAEKRDAITGEHDQKGSYGGTRGLCPVHVPEGATATARRGAKGVVITITPKDKPEELVQEIEGRIAKAADWVKANVKEAAQGNQGGVGGGKGEDGSNHSGKGDGKGRERKKTGEGGGMGTGGGGGKGTGGGGGMGTGSGGGKGTGGAGDGGGSDKRGGSQ